MEVPPLPVDDSIAEGKEVAETFKHLRLNRLGGGGGIGHEGGAYMPVTPGVDAGEGNVKHQLDKGGCTGAGSVPRGVPF